MGIVYKFDTEVRLIQPLEADKYDLWYFDENSGRLVLYRSPKATPYYTVQIYQMNNTIYGILYKTTFYKKLTLGLTHSTFNESFIVFRKKGSRKYFLYDVRRGSFPGQFVVPETDSCVPNELTAK